MELVLGFSEVFVFLLAMTDSKIFATEQEAFWGGGFGDAYTDRNDGDVIARSNLLFWRSVLKRMGPIVSCFGVGRNRGLNLDASKALLPSCDTSGLEINSYAAKECAAKGHQVFEGTILAPPPAATASNGMADLSIASGVLIHINPVNLNTAYELLYALSKRYILLSEYFNPSHLLSLVAATRIGFSSKILPVSSGCSTLP
jgi:pseudaminic acid biosynthesis-associated methylase